MRHVSETMKSYFILLVRVIMQNYITCIFTTPFMESHVYEEENLQQDK